MIRLYDLRRKKSTRSETMSGIGKAVFNTLNYVNPFSEGFKKDFAATKDWSGVTAPSAKAEGF